MVKRGWWSRPLGYCPVCGNDLHHLSPSGVHARCRGEVPEAARLTREALIVALTVPAGAKSVLIRQLPGVAWEDVVP